MDRHVLWAYPADSTHELAEPGLGLLQRPITGLLPVARSRFAHL
jgi:hypothetical protein